jgi:hypothetical protein
MKLNPEKCTFIVPSGKLLEYNMVSHRGIDPNIEKVSAITKMKNLEKCTFSAPSRKLLGYMVSHHGIDPNPEKVLVITKMKPPKSLHDVQKMMGCMAALSRFIS